MVTQILLLHINIIYSHEQSQIHPKIFQILNMSHQIQTLKRPWSSSLAPPFHPYLQGQLCCLKIYSFSSTCTAFSQQSTTPLFLLNSSLFFFILTPSLSLLPRLYLYYYIFSHCLSALSSCIPQYVNTIFTLNSYVLI